MKEIKQITIVGGGTSGWLTAAWFTKKYSPYLKVNLIDKQKPDRIGVGEATILSFSHFMRQLGYKDTLWLPKLDATFKAGIMFPGWGHTKNTLWHPFNFTSILQIPYYDVWSAYQTDFNVTKNQALYDTSINNHIEFNEVLKESPGYAYHIDCEKLVNFIQNDIQENMTYIQSEVKEIKWKQDHVETVILENQQHIKSDLFIDCSGFKQVLAKEPKNKTDLSDRLYVNTALSAHVDYQDKQQEMHPYTTCEALQCGWSWHIPLQSRIGTGLVFNRTITPIQEAEDLFIKYWNKRITKNELKVHHWDPFVKQKPWLGNVVSIGLSAGFIEPLESTSIALATRAIEVLDESLKGGFYQHLDVDMFNITMSYFYEQAIDFVNMHYSYTQRKSPFWDYVKEQHKKSYMQHFIESRLNDADYRSFYSQKFSFFTGHSWASLLYQLMPNIVPKTYFNHLKSKLDLELKAYFTFLKTCKSNSINHQAAIEKYCQINS